ncbi:OLC1v1038372C1 [Oldenlandia corymbosa var. corymbosa]|uniref:OLC1v1038372C1 n=1 Tax=Oldenlandia corymbosa var. corymbosa TaxID=529605 RepID=A0AAV1D0U5_OLDCO|nr:OLC1v1038372C1 [Oldenlandia corymbosa var. corymbosa]
MEPGLLMSAHQVLPSAPSVGVLQFPSPYKANFLRTPRCYLRSPVSVCGGNLEKTVFLGEKLNFLGARNYFLGGNFGHRAVFMGYKVDFVGGKKELLGGNSGKKTVCLSGRLDFGGGKNEFAGGNYEFSRRNVVKGGAVKRRKELSFDNVIQKDKKLKLVLKIRRILMSQPDRVMQLRDLGRFRRALGLEKRRRFIALLRKFPAVFEIVEEGVYSLRFKLTPEAERLYLEEMRIKNEMEEILVVKLRKMLMMSAEKRILLKKLAHLKNDFGLPLDFQDTICRRYPQYFKVVSTGSGPALELTHWDPELAVSAAELAEEENRAREIEERDLIIDRPPKFNRVRLPKGLSLSKGEMRKISQFREIPYISPYSDFSHLRSGTIEKEKHACGVVHEILSLTLEKRTLVDHLTHFREEFRFSQQLRGMLIRHPDMFYVSLKGDRDSVFLREAYRDSQLIEKDRLLLIKEKLRALVNVPRFPRRGVPRKTDTVGTEGSEPDQEGGSGTEEEEDDWSDMDNVVNDEFDDEDFGEDDEDFDDIFSNEEDDLPPDFNDNDGIMNLDPQKTSRKGNSSDKKDEKVQVPVLPDGRPRERW